MTGPKLITANVLLIDVIGYSARNDDQQSQIIEILNQLVNDTPTMNESPEEERLCLSTGDGMAVAFFGDPRYSVYLTLELDERIKAYNSEASIEDQFEVRMGTNQGMVYIIKDINERNNLAGDGINRAQRVMDCGDNGHLLISQSFADALTHADSSMANLFHPLGEFEVKHGQKVTIANIYDEEHGNSEMPTRMRRVGGMLYDAPPVLRIMLAISRPLLGNGREASDGRIILDGSTDAKLRVLPPPANCMGIDSFHNAIQRSKVHAEISELHGTTARSLVETFIEHDIGVLHFDGHGAPGGAIVLEDQYGEAHTLSPELLTQAVSENGIKLVVLNSTHVFECADALRNAGIPAVVGISDTMNQEAASTFISRFYRELATGRTVDDAVERGRLMIKLLFEDGSGHEDLITYSADDGKIILVQAAHEEAPAIFTSCSTKNASIPESDMPFVGREQEMVQLARALENGGFVALCGDDGTGKTSLARKVAQWHAERGRFPGGIFWINMDYDDAKGSILNGIGVELAGYSFNYLNIAKKTSFVNNYLENNSSLIILDGFDEAIKDNELQRWLSKTVKFPSALLIISEHDFETAKIERLQELTPYEAREIFIRHAKYRGWGDPTEEELAKIDEICNLLNYIPLAMVLVASHTAVSSLDELKSEIERGLKAISYPGAALLSEQYHIVDVCLTISYKLMDSEDAELLLKRLLLINGRADDEFIKAASGVNNWQTIIENLIKVSLLRRDGSCYRLHSLIRQYAKARSGPDGLEETEQQKVQDIQQYYKKSSGIKEELENKARTAASLARASLLYENKGDTNAAVRLLAVAHDMFAAIGSPETGQIQQHLYKLRDKVGDDVYNFLVNKARTTPEAVVREILGKNQRRSR